MRVKKLIVLVILLTLTMTLAACSVGSIIKGLTGGKVDIDKDGNINIEDEDGSYQAGDNVKWNKDKMHGLKQPDCKLTAVINNTEGTSYMFEKMDSNGYEKLIKDIKDMGFTYNIYEMENSIFAASDKEGLGFSVIYDAESKTGSITAVKGDPPDENEEYHVGDQKWDGSKIGGLPDPGGVITAYSRDNESNEAFYILTGLSNHQGYVDKLIGMGYNDVIDQASDVDYFYWNARKSNGDEVAYSSFGETVTITYKKG